MATKVKGITIELTADTSGIETALKEVNKELSSTQKQLSSVNKSLKLNPGNVELLEQKERLLGKAVEETTKKLEALKAAQANIKENGGENSAQYDALTREISDATVKLTQFKSEQQSTSQALQSAQSLTSGFAQGLQQVGNVAGIVAEKTRALSAAAAAALGGLTAMAMKAASTADDWATMAQQTGLSTEAIQKFDYAAEQIDVPLETIISSVNTMKRHLDDTSGVWEQIGVKVRDQRGEYRAIEDIFNDSVRALGNIKNETERDTKAMKIFGRSANELAGLLDDGGQKMRALGDEAENMGVIVSDEQLEKLNHFNDLLDGMKKQMGAAMMEAAVPVVEALGPALEYVAETVRVLAEAFARIPTPVMEFLVVFLTLLAVLAPVAKGINLVCNSFLGLITVLPQVGAAIGSLITQASAAVAANPYIGVVLAIIAALAVLALAIYEIVQHWDELSAAGRSAVSAVKSAVGGMGDKVKSIAESAASALKLIPEAITSVASKFSELASAATNVAGKVRDAFESLRDKAFKVGSEVMGAFARGIKSAIDQVTRAVQNLISTLSSLWDSATRDAQRAGQQTGTAYASAYNQSSSQIKQPVISTGASISSSILSALGSSSRSSSTTSAPMAATPVNVNVELVGSAKNIFDTVRVQNNRLTTATGYHALA